jgi:hypothetical protein
MPVLVSALVHTQTTQHSYIKENAHRQVHLPLTNTCSRFVLFLISSAGVFGVRKCYAQLDTGEAALRQWVRDTLLEFLAAAAASSSPHPNIVAFRSISFLADGGDNTRKEGPEFRLAFELCTAGTIFSVLFPADGRASPLHFHDRLRLAREVETQSAYPPIHANCRHLNVFLFNPHT